MPTKTIADVELMAVGTHTASNGRSTVTAAHLREAVAACHDHLIDRPPIKLGHVDPRFSETALDGSPAYGWVENLRTSRDGQKLIGDLAHIPSQLAEIIPAAFRRRSVELKFGVTGASGRVYRMALSALALLGVTPPAVKGLADITVLYSDRSAEFAGTVAFPAIDDDPALNDTDAAAIATYAQRLGGASAPIVTAATAGRANLSQGEFDDARALATYADKWAL